MQLTCPNCGERVSSEHINIQHMTAVCPECSTVFRFDPPDAKTKRRKVKQPADLTVRELDDGLSLSFRTNFRLDQHEAFLTTALLSVLFTFMTVVTVGGFLGSDVPFFMPLGFGLAASFLYYRIALLIYNRTHIDVNEESIHVSRQPLPNPFTTPQDIDILGIERIRFEETLASRQQGYDTPRFHVWAETPDGRRKPIVSDVVDDYAVFITQRLTEHLDLGARPDVARLMVDDEMDETYLADEPFLRQDGNGGQP